MRPIFIAWAIMFTFIHAGLTDDAYSAYKKGNKTKAFALYTKGAAQGNTKAIYNLAVFYEKGIGTKKNLPEALKLYKKVTLTIKGSNNYCSSSSQNRYYKKSFKKLAFYTKDSKYTKRLEILESQCVDQENPFMDEDRVFMKQCSSAKIIPVKYRQEIFRLPCHYFRHYPKIMKQYMPLYQQITKFKRSQNISEAKAKVAERKLRKLVRPILKEIKKKEIICYKKAKTVGDQEHCHMMYITGIDTLFVTDLSTSYSDTIHLYGTEEAHKKEMVRRKRIVSKEEKEHAVQQLKNELLKGKLIPSDYKLGI